MWLPHLWLRQTVLFAVLKEKWGMGWISSTSTWTWKAPQGQQVVLNGSWWPGAPCHCSLLLACCVCSSNKDTILIFWALISIQRQSCWQMSFGDSTCWGGTSGGRTFLPLHLGRRFPTQSLGKQGGGRERWKEKQPLAGPSAGNQQVFQCTALRNRIWSWLRFGFCSVRNCKAASSQSALERL